MPDNPKIQAALVRWANNRWPAESYSPDTRQVTAVKFEDSFDPGWSENTPGMGETTEVYVQRGTEQWHYAGSEKYASDLIEELLGFLLDE